MGSNSPGVNKNVRVAIIRIGVVLGKEGGALKVDPTKFDIKIRCIYEIKGKKEAPPFELSNDRDLKFYILSENPLEVLLYLSFEPTSNRSMKVLNKDYNSVSVSNQVQNLNPYPPIEMYTLDENEVDIGEVQSVEMYNELFDIPEQRDAPTKDCKRKGKVDYSSSSRKLKTKGSGFLNCIRPVIVMDGTFLKNKYWGQLIVAVCLDGNNQIYHLAFGVVDRETDDSIQWFLEKLKCAIGEVPSLGFVTDRKTCFSKGISSVFPSAFHDLCVQHLSQNLHDKYKNDTVATLFYNASRTYRESTFVEACRHLLAFPNGSGKYLNDVGIAR
ncbi:MuDRA-like transposase [Cucumis melo var. makuwa]|uniref:MuDRA-like transposase n=1 Tax=Cucumis melo var. makuwa TaxID=1194695 RepID=A0A5A7SWW7_CUCMM|nr:MuDRA-like transposase [Cucumis melo var. makuwa]